MKAHYPPRVSSSNSPCLPTALLLACAAMSAPALAVDFYWEGDDDYVSNASFWAPDYGTSPGTVDDVANTTDNVFHQTNGILNVNTNWSVNQILAGYVSTGESDQGTATIKQIDGNVFVNGYLRLGALPGSSATYDISGGTLTLRGNNTDGPLQVGYNGNGTLNISGNAVVNAGYRTNGWSPAIRVGEYNATGQITVHDGQKGIINQSGNSTVNVGRLLIGASGGNGEYNLSGNAVINTSSWFLVGGYGGANATFTMTGGELNVGASLGYNKYLELHSNPNGDTSSDKSKADVELYPNTSTKNGTHFMVGAVARNNSWDEADYEYPTGYFTQTAGKTLIVGDAWVGNGESATNGQGGATGTVDISGGTFTCIGDLYLGRKSGTGTLIVSGGELKFGSTIWVGTATGIRNSDNKISGAGDQRNGNVASKGTIEQTGGSIVVYDNVKLGDSPAADTLAAEGTWNMSGNARTELQWGFFVGVFGKGTFTIKDNAELVSTFTQADNDPLLDATGFIVGTNQQAIRSVGTFTQEGGLVSVENAFAAISRNGGIGTYDISGGEAKFRELFLGFHQLKADGGYNNGQMTGGVGTLNLRGGVLSAKKIDQQTADNTAHTGIINFNGGTLKASDTAAGVWITDQIDELNVLAGGGVIDTNGRTVEIAAPLSGAGALEVIGGGALTFTGDNSNYTGAISITSGSGVIAASAVLAIVLDGAAAGIESGTADADNPLSVTGGGAITIADGATLNVVLRNAGSLAEGTYVYNVFVGNVSYDAGQLNLVTGASGNYSYTLNANGTLTVQVVPEPGTYALLGGVGLLGLVVLCRRKAKA